MKLLLSPRQLSWSLLLIALVAAAAPAEAATPVEVDASIAKAVTFLESIQKNGNWEIIPAAANGPDYDPGGGQWTGLTAITTYALICAGENPNRAPLSEAIQFLAAHPSRGVYSSACRCLVWSRIKLTPTLRAAADLDVKLLLSAMKSAPPARGMESYVPSSDPKSTQYDHSTSQFAVLGLSVLTSQGFEVPREFWQLSDDAWRAHQDSDGSWCYIAGGGGDRAGEHTAAMTGAGVATLFLTQTQLREGAACHGNDPDLNIERGLDWLGKNAKLIIGLQRNYHFENYTLFTASRVGLASGEKCFGDTDWYQLGTDFLIHDQNPNGSFPGFSWPQAETSLGLLFLTYGSAPIVVNKLHYGVPPERGNEVVAHWNQRPHDLLNFTDWMGAALEKRLNWQIVSLAKATVDDLHEAPLLFISGDQSLQFSPDECAKLRQFVEEGGCILGNDDCESLKFAKSFAKLGTTLFPSYEFRQLSPNHPIFQNEQFPASKWKTRPALRGLSNGVRELMLLPSVDLSRTFQSRSSLSHPEMFQLPDDIVLYCAGGVPLRRKGETYIVRENPTAPIGRSIKLARLQYDGNWDPEPGGWRRLKAVLHNSHHIALDVQPVKLSSQIPAEFKVAHLTGTATFRLDDTQRKNLLDFVQAGGTLVIDAAGGSAEFADSVEALLKTMFGNDATAGLATPLPLSSAVYNLPGLQINSTSYRVFARGNSVGRLSSPRLYGISQNRRIVAFFSREDLSNALVGATTDGIIGYTPESATALMRNIFLFAAQ